MTRQDSQSILAAWRRGDALLDIAESHGVGVADVSRVVAGISRKPPNGAYKTNPQKRGQRSLYSNMRR